MPKKINSSKSPSSTIKKAPNKKTAVKPGKTSDKHFLKTLSLSLLLIILAFSTYKIYKRLYVVRVNGQLINQVEYYRELEKREGKNVLEDLIIKKIISQEAEKAGIDIPKSEINAEVAKLREELKNQGSTLEDVLALQGLNYEDLLENIEIQKTLENLLSGDIVVKDEEVQSRIDENKDFYSEGANLETAKENIRLQIFQEKLASAYRNWIQEKRSQSKIEYLR